MGLHFLCVLLDLSEMCLQLDCISNLDLVISYVSSPYYCLFVLVYQQKKLLNVLAIFL